MSRTTTQPQPQPRRPHGPLERRPLEDRHVRLARLRHRRFRARRHGRHEYHRPDSSDGPGESGRMDRILDAGFKQPAGENILIQSRTHRAGEPAFKAAVPDVVARVSRWLADVIERSTAVRSRRTGEPCSSSSTFAATRGRPSTRSTPASTRSPPRNAPILASSSACSAMRARKRESRRRTRTTWGRRACSRSRSRCSSSCSRSAPSWRQAFRCCSG